MQTGNHNLHEQSKSLSGGLSWHFIACEGSEWQERQRRRC